MAEVKLQNVYKTYDDNTVAVRDLNITVADKEFVVLVGPSGCGKSTALRMIAGLEEITQGTISINGSVVNSVAPKDRDIAMVFQNYALYPHMSVYENLAFGLKMRKYDKHEIRRRVETAAKILGLELLLDRKPKALSGGQRQRVAVGRAIVRQPKVFLFDEPLSNLDANLRVQMRTEISRLHRQLQATIIYVTHDQVEAMSMGDRIVVMNNGVAQQIDTPMNIYDHPANRFVAGFIGSPAMNFISGSANLTGEACFREDHTSFNLPIPAPVSERIRGRKLTQLTLGIRPEHIYASKPANDQGLVPFMATVEVVEPVGNEAFVYFSTGSGVQYVSRTTTGHLPSVGSPVEMMIDTSKIHFFDQETGQAI